MSKFKRFGARLIAHKRFEAIILIIILIDSVQLGYYHFMITPEESLVLMVIDRFFFIVFSIEATIKIIVHQTEYFRNRWNLFDFIIL